MKKNLRIVQVDNGYYVQVEPEAPPHESKELVFSSLRDVFNYLESFFDLLEEA